MRNLTSTFSHLWVLPASPTPLSSSSPQFAASSSHQNVEIETRPQRTSGFTHVAVDPDQADVFYTVRETFTPSPLYAENGHDGYETGGENADAGASGTVKISVVRVSRKKGDVGNGDQGDAVSSLDGFSDDGVARSDGGQQFGHEVKRLQVPHKAFEISDSNFDSQVISFKYFPDDQSLCVITASGEIVTLRLESGSFDDSMDGPDFDKPNDEEVGNVVLEFASDDAPSETVGSVPSGLKSAAWSPDDEQLVLVTGEDELLVMTRYFDVIYEGPLRPEQFGDDSQINVGWGSKRTQFHGSLGKAAAASADQPKENLPQAHSSDSGHPRITWRGDGQYFAVSSIDSYNARPELSRRQIRVYSRDPNIALSTTSEPIYGMEGALAWRPSGNLIATTQRFGYTGGAEGQGGDKGRCDIIFLERNGLQHGSFSLREETKRAKDSWKVVQMAYSCDSAILAVWIRAEDEDVVQLWTMSNYHYYLKQSLQSPLAATRFSSMCWHPEKADTIFLTGDDFVQMRTFSWETVTSLLPLPMDTGSVAVIDGDRLLMTSFRNQNVPPPMSSYQIPLKATPIHIAFSSIQDSLAVLFDSGAYQVWDLNTRIAKPGQRGGGKVANPVVSREAVLPEAGGIQFRQISLGSKGQVVALGSRTESGSEVIVQESGFQLLLPASVGRIVCRGSSERDDITVAICEDGLISTIGSPKAFMGRLPAFCFDVFCHIESGLLFALSYANKLMVSDLGGSTAVFPIAGDCNSFTVTNTHLVWTTTSHTSVYAPLEDVKRVTSGSTLTPTLETRRVERGSRIVTVVPSAMTLVLQMPRGNLETISPRALVLQVIQQDIRQLRYRSAFLACRRHRIDLNILVDVDFSQFMSHLPEFLEQIPEVDYLNLFVSGLKNTNVAKDLYPQLNSTAADDESKVNRICDAIRRLLEPNLLKYVETILTTHVCRSPPDLEAGLAVLHTLKVSHPEVVDEAIKYIIFLTDVNKLFDVALGMYDFQLVLMVAQYSQKDPKEYLPFLRELKALERNYQRFRIDDHLGRFERALEHLKETGNERKNELIEYVQAHALYPTALKLFADDAETLKDIYVIYGEHLLSAQDHMEAAKAFVLAGATDAAMNAYEHAQAWRELFTLAIKKQFPVDEMQELCERVAERLSVNNKPLEASRVMLDYGRNVDEAIALEDRQDLVHQHLYPGLEDAAESVEEQIREMEGQLDKELKRMEELMVRLESETDAFFGVDFQPQTAVLDNVDVATEATTAITAFTRFTVGATTIGGTSLARSESGKSNASSRRKARKKVVGRKGTVDEFEYLLASLKRLLVRLEQKFEEIEALLPHLLLATKEHADTGRHLADIAETLDKKVRNTIDADWSYKTQVDTKRLTLIEEEMATVLAGMHLETVGHGTGVVVGMMKDRLIAAEKERMALGVPSAAGNRGAGEDGPAPENSIAKPVWKGWQGNATMGL